MKVGDKVPEILGVDQDGKEVRLSDYKGRKLAIYFYPKDNTPGCTAEACSVRDSYAQIRKAGYDVLGVSTDSVASHMKFAQKHELPFRLVADVDKTLVEAFGVWAEKKLYGKSYMGTVRTTFLVDQNGIVEQIIGPKEIKTVSHGQQILNIPNQSAS